MSNPGDKVTESVELKERGDDNGVPREVDILLETRVHGMDMRIAIECRGRTAKDDIKWIDELIGKYSDLGANGVNKIVAVSQSGFSKGAQKKAAENLIDTLTLQEALEINWPSEFTRLGVGTTTRNDIPQEIRIISEPLLTSPLSLSTPLLTEKDEFICTIEQAAVEIYKANQDSVNKLIGKQMESSLKTLADLQELRSGFTEITFTLPVPVYIKNNDEQVEVKQIILNMVSTFSFQKNDAVHFTLGNKQITQSIVTDDSNGKHSILAIQEADKPNQARLHIEKIVATLPKKTKKRKS